MSNNPDNGAAATALTDSASPSTGSSPDAPARRGLRSALLRGQVGDDPVWRRFLATEDPALALALWFGRSAEALRGNSDRLPGLVLRDIAELEVLLTRQLNAVLHHRRFQRLEAAWRGVAMVVEQSGETDNSLVRILNVRWSEIARDLDRAVEFDQSQMFHLIYSQEFDMPGGQPYGLLIGDYEVAHKPRPGHAVDDISVLTGLSQIAMAAFAPLLVGAAPELFGLHTFREFGLPINLRVAMDQPEYQRFNRLRSTEEARFLGILVPHILLRAPHLPNHENEIGFPYREDRFGLHVSDMLWGNAGFAYACVVLRAFGRYGWFANIRGSPEGELGGGMVDDLPQVSFGTDRPGIALKYGTDVSITDQVEQDLNELGFIALVTAKDTPYAIFYGNQSLHIPRNMTNSAAKANERLSSMLRYVLCASRFAHYIKVMMRERIGRFETPERVEEFLSDWLREYATNSETTGGEMRARYPLRAGHVQVREISGKPGSYRCVMHIQPHFHLDQVVSAFRLVTELGNLGSAR